VLKSAFIINFNNNNNNNTSNLCFSLFLILKSPGTEYWDKKNNNLACIVPVYQRLQRRCVLWYENSSGDEIANVLVNDDIAHT